MPLRTPRLMSAGIPPPPALPPFEFEFEFAPDSRRSVVLTIGTLAFAMTVAACLECRPRRSSSLLIARSALVTLRLSAGSWKPLPGLQMQRFDSCKQSCSLLMDTLAAACLQ